MTTEKAYERQKAMKLTRTSQKRPKLRLEELTEEGRKEQLENREKKDRTRPNDRDRRTEKEKGYSTKQDEKKTENKITRK